MNLHYVVIGAISMLMLHGCGGERADQSSLTGTTSSASGAKQLAAATVVTNTFSGLRADYAITSTANGYAVTDNVGNGGTRTFTGLVQRLTFADMSVALGSAAENPGKAYRLYRAAFDRVPDLPGLGVQIDALDRGATLEQISSNFLNSAEFKSLYGDDPSDSTLVTLLYRNVLHREPEPAGFNHWMGVLGRKELTRAQVLYYFSESAENQAQVTPYILNGIIYIDLKTTPYVPLPVNVQTDSMAFISALGSGRTEIATSGSAGITLASTMNATDTAITYQIGMTGGSVSNGAFLSPLTLPAVSQKAMPFRQDFGVYKTMQYNALIKPSTPANTAYAVSIQTLAQHGIKDVAMGHWKYFGPSQTGYFEGTKIAHGSFLIGTPSPASAISSIDSGTYSGYLQAGTENTTYIDSADQLRGNAKVTYDKTTRLVKIEISGLQYWTANFMAIESAKNFFQYENVFLPDNLGCTAIVPENSNAFSCTMEYGKTGYDATFKGNFFGATGTEMGVSFAVKGFFISTYTKVAAGGLIAKRN